MTYVGFTNELPDSPAPGVSTVNLTFTANLYDMNVSPSDDCLDGPLVYDGTDILFTDWAEVIRPPTAPATHIDEYFLGDPYFSARMSVQTPATSPKMHAIIQYDDAGQLIPVYWEFLGSAAAVDGIDTTSAGDLFASGIVDEWIDPPDPVQPDATPIVTDVIDSRPTDAIWQNGLLTWVSTNPCTPIATKERACVRVTQLNTGGPATSPPTLAQDFLIGEDAADNYFGGIGQSGNGTLHVVWTRSSATAGDEPASRTAYQLPTDAANTLRGAQEIADGSGALFTGDRWGDYVGVAQDPQVPNAVWQGNQFATGGENWDTTVSQLQTGGATYVPIDPLRVLDSRINVGVTGIFNASTPKTFVVAGFTSPAGTIPADAIAVTGNVTVTGQTAAGYVSITTTPTSTPASSTLNFPTKDTRANNLTSPVASNGRLSAVYKAAAGKRAHILFDVTGYFLPGTEDAGYNTLAPIRVLDSRAGQGIGLTGRVPHRLPPGARDRRQRWRSRQRRRGDGQPDRGRADQGRLRVDHAHERPQPDHLEHQLPGRGRPRQRAHREAWGAARSGSCTRAAAGSRTDLILDITGYYLPAGDGLAFHALNPGRIMDTRTSLLSGLTGAFNHNASRALDTDGHWGVPAGADAVTGNLTVTGQTRSGYVSITPDTDPAPTTSTINFPLGDTRANGVTVPLNGSGNMSLIYRAAATSKTNVLLDVSGYFK